jgi:hypothetical protein
MTFSGEVAAVLLLAPDQEKVPVPVTCRVELMAPPKVYGEFGKSD